MAHAELNGHRIIGIAIRESRDDLIVIVYSQLHGKVLFRDASGLYDSGITAENYEAARAAIVLRNGRGWIRDLSVV